MLERLGGTGRVSSEELISAVLHRRTGSLEVIADGETLDQQSQASTPIAAAATTRSLHRGRRRRRDGSTGSLDSRGLDMRLVASLTLFSDPGQQGAPC